MIFDRPRDDIDAELDAIRADFQARENAEDARSAKAYATRQATHMQTMRARLLAREWHPPCPCQSCWRAAYLMRTDLLCRWAQDSGNYGGVRIAGWWEP